MPFSQEEIEFKIHSASTVASKFAVFKSRWLQCVGILQEKVYKRRVDWSRRPQAPHKKLRTECTKLDHAVIQLLWISQDRRRSFRALFLISTLCFQRWLRSFLLSLISRTLARNRPVWVNCSCQIWRCTLQWPLSNLQGKAVTLIRWGGLSLC